MKDRPLPLDGAVKGAALGLLFALLALAVGVFRMMVYFVITGALPGVREGDLIKLLYYVTGFIVAGVVVGVSGEYFPGRKAVYGRFAVGGMVVMLGVLTGDSDSLATIDSFDVGIVVFLGGLFGVAAATGWVEEDQS